ncbi:MAG: hypothetical protein ACLRS8_04470 [Parabacteroides merdae]
MAPAANGKGCINDMRHPADLYEELIKTETGQAEAEYMQALEEWEQKKAEAHQKHRSVVVKDAPKPAAIGLPQHPDAGHQSQDACPPARQRQHRRADG